MCSVWPFDCGWKPYDRLTDAPSKLQNSYQKWAADWGTLLEENIREEAMDSENMINQVQ